MSLLDKIEEDIKISMKARDAQRLETLRMAKAAITNAAISKKKDRLEDAEILDVLDKQVKQRRESHECFKKGGRLDLAQKEAAEIEILQQYLPKQMSREELRKHIQAAVQNTGAKGAGELGKVMKELMPVVKGKADGKLVNQMVLEELG